MELQAPSQSRRYDNRPEVRSLHCYCICKVLFSAQYKVDSTNFALSMHVHESSYVQILGMFLLKTLFIGPKTVLHRNADLQK